MSSLSSNVASGNGADSGQPKPEIVIATVMATAVATVFPGFLIGALSVQVSAEFGIGEGPYGWGLGAFFLAAAFGSMMLGRLVQVIGPRNQLTFALIGTIVIQLCLATIATEFWMVVGFLAVAGLLNSAAQTAVNLALIQAKLPRLGLAIAFKQSGMPMASMVAGFVVPAIALTVGWRWGYVLGAVIAIGALVAVRIVVKPIPVVASQSLPQPVSSKQSLWTVAAGGMFLAFAAGAINAWTVGSGVDAGMSEGSAGIMLSGGAATGICFRLFAGARVDTLKRSAFRVAASILVVGVAGIACLSFRIPAAHVAATFAAFGGGWIWPVFVNFGIVKTNAEAAGAATGITQTGVYVGVFSAPLVTGRMIEATGYPTMWLLVAGSAAVGACILVFVSGQFDVRPMDEPDRIARSSS